MDKNEQSKQVRYEHSGNVEILLNHHSPVCCEFKT
jgi:hypothetical protein